MEDTMKFWSKPRKWVRTCAPSLVSKNLFIYYDLWFGICNPKMSPKMNFVGKKVTDRGLLGSLVSRSCCNEPTCDRTMKKQQFRLDFPCFAWSGSLFQPFIPLQSLHPSFGAYLGYAFICFYLALTAFGSTLISSGMTLVFIILRSTPAPAPYLSPV